MNQHTNPLAETFPPLGNHQAAVEANRCLFCYDAPCTHACPTHIDIPRFIRKISTGNLIGSARAILEANLLGATCARVCPVQELCEGACVLGADHNPIAIGRLQRYAMDHIYSRGITPVRIAATTGKSVAVIGAGPAGLSCAGELARRGHSVTVFEKRELGGGLSTYGIISLREPIEASLAEVKMIERLGVKMETGIELGSSLKLDELQDRFDAVFLGLGLGATPSMRIPGEELILDGLAYIEESKLNAGAMKVGRSVAVIGAGNTAIDCATIARRLGAEQVTMIYRRTAQEMTAYPHEYEFIKKEGVEFRFLTQPVRVLSQGARVTGLSCIRMELDSADAFGRRTPRPANGPEFTIAADQVVKAIGQEKPSLAQRLGLAVDKGFIRVDASFETSIPGVFAGGDCVRASPQWAVPHQATAPGRAPSCGLLTKKDTASTVMAVQDGKLAAAVIDERIGNSDPEPQPRGAVVKEEGQ
ncbi:MAG: NAD(P)-dependent oxidoreductase [Acidobacteriia bacterium]|nr:NAD(P)-dependent oxidoreductase [Terriglobia bacterium]